MITPEMPDRPWAKTGADIFELNGHGYLLRIGYLLSGLKWTSWITSPAGTE